MSAYQYLNMTMQQLGNLLHNTSQSNSIHNSKDTILDSIKSMLRDYNNIVEDKDKIDIVDYRK